MKKNQSNWRNRIVETAMVPCGELLANEANWRIHPKPQQSALTGILNEVGWVQQVIVNKRTSPEWQANRNIETMVDGHLRVSLALSKGEDVEVPVVFVDLTPNEEALVLATFDPISAMAAADKEQLDALLRDVQSGDQAVQEMLAELAKDSGLDYRKEKAEAPEPQLDKAAELQEKWQTALGQLWEMGRHRLICGDCTDSAVVDRLMGGSKPFCTVTDPPYGVGVDYDSFEDKPENVKRLIDKAMPIIFKFLPAAITTGVPAMWDYPRPAWVGSWVHPASTSSSAWGFVGSNPILYYGKDPYLSAGKGRRDSSLVLVSDRKGENEHPVSKPLNVWEWLIERMTPIQDAVVFDPFVGSGTTVVACERLGRVGYGCELSPAYAAVALERLSDMGLSPRLVSA